MLHKYFIGLFVHLFPGNAGQDPRNWMSSHSVQGAGKLVVFSDPHPFISSFIHLVIHFTNPDNIEKVLPLGCLQQARKGCDLANSQDRGPWPPFLCHLSFLLGRKSSEQLDNNMGPASKGDSRY